MVMEGHDKYDFRKANSNDNLLEIVELLYNTILIFILIGLVV